MLVGGTNLTHQAAASYAVHTVDAVATVHAVHAVHASTAALTAITIDAAMAIAEVCGVDATV